MVGAEQGHGLDCVGISSVGDGKRRKVVELWTKVSSVPSMRGEMEELTLKMTSPRSETEPQFAPDVLRTVAVVGTAVPLPVTIVLNVVGAVTGA